VPLTPVIGGMSRSPTGSYLPSSSRTTGEIPAICKQGVRDSSPLSSTLTCENSSCVILSWAAVPFNVPLVGRWQRACRTVVVLFLAAVGWFGGAYEEDRLDWA
jgi:hypothetical protein